MVSMMEIIKNCEFFKFSLTFHLKPFITDYTGHKTACLAGYDKPFV